MVNFGSSSGDAPTAFVVGGELEVQKRFIGEKNTRKRGKCKHKKTCKTGKTTSYKSGTAIPIGPYGDWGMVLDGGLAIKTTPGFRNPGGTRRRYKGGPGSKCTRRTYKAPAGTIYMGALYLDGALTIEKKEIGV